MGSLFSKYHLVKESGLFDESYYCKAYPEVTAARLDPLLHYLETGARELRNPSAAFDARSYVQLCQARGEQVENPLVHYIEVGAAQGLATRPPLNRSAHDAARGSSGRAPAMTNAVEAEAQRAISAADQLAGAPAMQLHIDAAERDDAGILHVSGWAAGLAPIVRVQVFIDDEKLAAADYGRRREDVGTAHPEYPNARHSGFELQCDISAYGKGVPVIKVEAVASTGISRQRILPLGLSGARRTAVLHGEEGKTGCFCERIEVTTDGRIAITGWAVGVAPTDRIAVEFDGEEIADAEIGLARPDVGNRFPTLPHARLAGFSFRHALAAIKAGEHLIVLRHRTGGVDTEISLPVRAVAGSGTDLSADTAAAPAAQELQLKIDLPLLVGGGLAAPVRGSLEIIGWALARHGIASIDVAIDGLRMKSVHTGIRRTDVQRAFPGWEGALTAGFSALLPQHSLPKGQHTVLVSLLDQTGKLARSEFRIEVEDVPDAGGPWALRRRMAPAEIDVRSRPLLGRGDRPSFGILLPLGLTDQSAEVRATLASLESQVYENWHLHVLAGSRRKALRAWLTGFDHLSSRVQLLGGDFAVNDLLAGDSKFSHFLLLRSGDELGCDALLEFAVQAVLHPEADFLYCDERRVSPVSGQMEAFFKPQWSPDLLLSMNYLGRAWCARPSTVRCAALGESDYLSADDYDRVLRLTESAAAIRHVPATLLQATQTLARNDAADLMALQRALTRRGVNASVKAGRARGTFRVQHKSTPSSVVSIIISTQAAHKLVRTCIETLRNLTAHRNFEIVCVKNILAEMPDDKDWLRAHADRVIETAEPFNWSRFNNRAAAAARGDFLLFLSDSTEVIEPAWLEALLEQAERSEVGAVGAQLLYPDRRVQHAGMFLAGRGLVRHAFRYAEQEDSGYFGLALTERDVSAVTGACLMTRRETFEALGGFAPDETSHPDVDYCLRARERGLWVIYTPYSKLVYHEPASHSDEFEPDETAGFDSKWRHVFAAGDPFFHPCLTRTGNDYSFEWEPAQLKFPGNPVLLRESIRRILVVKLDHIGDCVTALPAIRRLKRYFPEARLCVLTSRASRPAWALEPAVDEVIEFEFFHARSALGLIERTHADWETLRERLARQRFDLAVDLRKHWETRPVLRHTGARYLAGFDIKGRFPWLDIAIEWFEDSALLPKRQHAADDLVNLVDAIAAACETDRAVIAPMPRPLPKGFLAGVPKARRIFHKRVVCVHPAAGNEMRQWAPEYFSVLIDELIETEEVHVVLVGAPAEADIGAAIVSAVKNSNSVWSLIGHVGLADLPPLLDRCSLFVGNNSGPQHLAAGIGIPTIGIHSGVVDAREWGPKGTNALAIQRAMTCSPCYLSQLEDCPRGLACLRGLLPADVLPICQRLLAATARSSGARAKKRSSRSNGRPLASSI